MRTLFRVPSHESRPLSSKILSTIFQAGRGTLSIYTTMEVESPPAANLGEARSFDGFEPLAQGSTHEDDENVNEDTEDATDTRKNRRIRQCECLACWLYFGLTLVISYAIPFDVHKRPIPFQYLESSGEYIRNQIYDQPIPNETVSTTALVLICGLAPVVIQLMLSFALPAERRTLDRHRTLCVYLVGVGTNVVATECLKLYCGALRPIFYAVCQPDATYTACTTTDANELEDARKSFPSGHASQAWNGMMLLSLYLQRTWGVGRNPNGNSLLSRTVSILALLPLALAIWIAASRIQDNKHFPVDVVAGSVLGGTTAYYAHNLWFGRASEPKQRQS